jgi:hypothetical protein
MSFGVYLKKILKKIVLQSKDIFYFIVGKEKNLQKNLNTKLCWQKSLFYESAGKSKGEVA